MQTIFCNYLQSFDRLIEAYQHALTQFESCTNQQLLKLKTDSLQAELLNLQAMTIPDIRIDQTCNY